jgi:DNA-binding NtrC family response regulator
MTATNENGTILIVDDEEYICRFLSRFLRKGGLETMEVYEENSAVKMIVSQKPDVVLVDFRMPGMNGMKLLKRAKELDQDLPIVMITAYADIKGAVEAMRAGAHDYIAKPFENLEIIRVVYRALEERKLKRKLSNLTSELQGNLSLRTSMGMNDALCQLRSITRRAVLLANDIVSKEHFDLKSAASLSVSLQLKLQDLSLGSLSLKEIVRSDTFALEQEVLEKTLQYTGGNKAKAARLFKYRL